MRSVVRSLTMSVAVASLLIGGPGWTPQADAADFPAKGRSVSYIVPYGAGGPSDATARLLAAELEKQLGVPVQIVNRAGAGGQVGAAALAAAAPDGYTIGMLNLPVHQMMYMNPDRKATFTRGSFQLLAMHNVDVGATAVKADSPFMTLKDVVEAARAKPGELTATTSGLLTSHHLTILQLQRLANVKFRLVHFDSAAPQVASILGGHTQVAFGYSGDFMPQVKGKSLRAVSVNAGERSPFLPGVPTAGEQGYRLDSEVARIVAAPAGLPKETVEILAAALKKAMDKDDHKKKIEELGAVVRYMDPEQLSTYWTEVEKQVKPLMDEALQDAKKQ